MAAERSAPVAVLGAGSWGTALALGLGKAGHSVRLWGHRAETQAVLARERENRRHLPGLAFPDSLEVAPALDAAVDGVADVVVAVPFKGLESLLAQLAGIAPRPRLLLTCKGIEPHSGRLAHDLVAAVLGDAGRFAVLSGPTFAAEVAAGKPSAAVVASTDSALAGEMARLVHSRSFRIYSGSDVVGVEIAGALKNVLAIAAGISDGLGFGANARAALITRGLAEITRIGVALGARQETFAGLAGVGDIVLTCTDDQSRNRRLGLALAEGLGADAAMARIGQVTEGVPTASAARTLAERHAIEMPLSLQVARILAGELTPERAVGELLEREPRSEHLSP